MNKKLIAAAIAAVMAAPVVSAADTTLYGRLHADINSTDNGTTDVMAVSNRASRIGVKGSEDLGDGLKAIFGVELEVSVPENHGINGGRNAFVGLAGGFGTFLVGRHDTPAKIALNTTKMSVVSDAATDFEGSMDFTELRVDNAIAYVSPSFSGVTLAAAAVPGETASNDGLAEAYSLGLMYAGGGLKAGLGYEVAASGMTIVNGGTGGSFTVGAEDHKMWQATAAYTFGDFMVGGAYESTSDFLGLTNMDKEVWALQARANFGNNFVAAQYGQSDNDVLGDSDNTGLTLGHNFSKRTQVYAAYANSDVSGGADTDVFSLGMVHNF